MADNTDLISSTAAYEYTGNRTVSYSYIVYIQRIPDQNNAVTTIGSTWTSGTNG